MDNLRGEKRDRSAASRPAKKGSWRGGRARKKTGSSGGGGGGARRT